MLQHENTQHFCFKFAENCRKVCLAWRRYLHSSNKIWESLIGDQIDQALRMVSEYRTSVSGVGKGWLDDPSSTFFINNLEFACQDSVFIKGLNNRRVAARRLCKKMVTCELLRSTNFDPVLTFRQLQKAETEVESYRTLGSKMDPILEEFISSVTMETGFSMETTLQTRRIVELAAQNEEISRKFSTMKIVIVGAAIAGETLEEGEMPPSLIEDYFYGEDQEDSEEEFDSSFEDAKTLFKTKLQHSWYHPVPSLFVGLLEKIDQNHVEDQINPLQKYVEVKSNAMSLLLEGSMAPPSQIAVEAFSMEFDLPQALKKLTGYGYKYTRNFGFYNFSKPKKDVTGYLLF